MPKAGKNIYKRKDGRWEGRYMKEHVNGRKKYGSVYAASYRDVKAKLDAMKRKTQEKQVTPEITENISFVSVGWFENVSLILVRIMVIWWFKTAVYAELHAIVRRMRTSKNGLTTN